MMSKIFGEKLKKSYDVFELLPFFNFVLCNVANVIFRKVLEVEVRKLYQLIEYNEKIIWKKFTKQSYDYF